MSDFQRLYNQSISLEITPGEAGSLKAFKRESCEIVDAGFLQAQCGPTYSVKAVKG